MTVTALRGQDACVYACVCVCVCLRMCDRAPFINKLWLISYLDLFTYKHTPSSFLTVLFLTAGLSHVHIYNWLCVIFWRVVKSEGERVVFVGELQGTEWARVHHLCMKYRGIQEDRHSQAGIHSSIYFFTYYAFKNVIFWIVISDGTDVTKVKPAKSEKWHLGQCS